MFKRSNLIVFAFFCLILSCSSFAQGIQDEDIIDIFHDEQRTFNCERYKKLSAFLDTVPDQEITNRLNAEISGYTILLKSEDLSFKERKLIWGQVRILKKLLKYKSKNAGLKKFQEKICKTGETTGRIAMRGLEWMSNGIMVGLAVPLQAIGKMTRGLITGKARDHDGEIHYDFIGPSLYEGVGRNLLFSQRFLSLAMTQPWVFPLIAAPVIDGEVMKICKRKHSLRKDEIEFCRKFVGFKTSAMKLTTPFEKFGAKVNQLFTHKDLNVKDEAPYTQEEILKDLTQITEASFCSQMMDIGRKFKKSKKQIKAKSDLETWRIGTNPERYGQPDILNFTTGKDSLVKRIGTPFTSLRNVVISLGPSKWQTDGVDTKEITRKYQHNFKLLKKQLKLGRKIFQDADSIEECEALKEKYNFKYKEFETLASAVNEDELGKHLFESKRIKNLFKSKASLLNFTDTTKLQWEYISSGDIETIHEILRSKDVGNVIFVIHGSEKGKLIDSNMNELPRTMFSNLSPSIISLNFFSCFSQKIDQYYGISKELAKGVTYHPERHLSFVEEDPSYSYKQGQVPFESFPGYFSKLDFYLSKATRGNMIYESLFSKVKNEEPVNTCEFQIYHLGQQKSAYSVTINNVQIGTVTSPRDKSRFEFDCRILKEDKNSLRLINVNLVHNESLTLDQSKFYLVTPEQLKELKIEDLNVIKLKENVMGITGSF